MRDLSGLSVMISIIAFSACASAKRSPSPEISFSRLTTISYGETTADQLKSLFGEPQNIRKVPTESAELWIYKEGAEGTNPTDRANFWIELPSNRVMTAMWFARSDDRLTLQSAATDYFPHHKFTARDEGLVAHDAYSRNQIHTSEDGSVSISEHSLDKRVTSISLGIPQKRSLSSKGTL
jgi:hypothetical protein